MVRKDVFDIIIVLIGIKRSMNLFKYVFVTVLIIIYSTCTWSYCTNDLIVQK